MLHLPNLRRDVPLAPLTTYQIGGPADWFVEVATAAELTAAVQAARNEALPYFLLGSGANILIGDKGFRGLVIHNRARAYEFEGDRLTAESGLTVAELLAATTERGLSGLEHFVGIPSSLGGAIWQNLHFLAPNRQSTVFIESLVAGAVILDETGQTGEVDRNFFQFGYDTSILHRRPLVVLAVTLNLVPKDPKDITAQAEANLAWRRQKQPQLDEFASCGSVFQKIEGVGAGRLIEQAGLKGRRVGQIEVSTKHANYLVNRGGGKASDVRALIELIQKEVEATSGYKLKPEIGFVGEF